VSERGLVRRKARSLEGTGEPQAVEKTEAPLRPSWDTRRTDRVPRRR
jgi:hypothetical protein